MKYKIIILLFVLSAIVISPLFAGGGAEVRGTGGEGPEGTEPLDEIRLVGGFSTFELEGDPAAARIEEVLGVPINSTMLPPDAEGPQKLLLDLASGVPYDVALNFGSDAFFPALAAGAVLDITDLLEEHGQTIKEQIFDESWAAVTVNGRIMGIPRVSEQTGAVVEGMLIRKDILREIGKNIPGTPAELLDVARALKERYPDSYPMTTSLDQNVSGFWLPFVPVASAFGIANEWSLQDGEVVHAIKLDGMRDYLSYLNQLYNEGLIDPEFPAHTRDTRNERFVSGTSHMTKAHWWVGSSLGPVFDELGIDAEEAATFVPPFKDATGKQVVHQISGFGFTFIPTTAEDPVASIKWLNEFMKDENFERLYVGDENVHHRKEGGVYFPIQPAFDIINNSFWFIPAAIQKDNLSQRMWGARLQKSPLLVWTWDSLQNSSQEFVQSNPVAFAAPSDAAVEYLSSLRELVDTTMTNFIIEGFTDAEYDQFLSQWDREGGSEIELDYNSWYRSVQ